MAFKCIQSLFYLHQNAFKSLLFPRGYLNVQIYQNIRGYKQRDILELRCKDCFFQKVDDRWMVLCKTFPRHKQINKIEDIRKQWIVTHVTRTGRAFQKKEEAYILNTCPPGPFDYRKKPGQRIRKGNFLIGTKRYPDIVIPPEIEKNVAKGYRIGRK